MAPVFLAGKSSAGGSSWQVRGLSEEGTATFAPPADGYVILELPPGVTIEGMASDWEAPASYAGSTFAFSGRPIAGGWGRRWRGWVARMRKYARVVVR